MMKNCELCSSIARMFCESDQASLCWSCDAKVHSANFLVAKHTRTLLCQTCQSLTPWTGSGPKLGHTLSVCESCVHGDSNQNSRIHDDDDEHENDEDDDDEEEEEDEDEEQEEDDGENQVVPLSSSSLAPPQVTSSSSSGETSDRLFNGAQSSRQPRFSIPWRRNQ